MNGIVWKDDSQVAWMLRTKSITDHKEGSTTIFIKEMTNEVDQFDNILAEIKEKIDYRQ